jgi:hypothetical protein
MASTSTLFAGVAAGVVGANHQHRGLRLDAVDIAMIEPPQHMLRAIAADAEVHGIPLGVKLFPHLLALSFPTLRDRIADQQQVDVAFLHALVEAFVPLHPAPFFGRRNHSVVGLHFWFHIGLGFLPASDRSQAAQT